MLKYPISGRNTVESIRDTERDNLYIGWDEEDGFVFLFTPTMKNTDNHYHIELTEDGAMQPSLFLSRKLEEIKVERGKRSSETLTNP